MRAFTVPGTGPGVGEQQCFVRRTTFGREVVQTLLVTAEVPEQFAETTMQGSRAGSRFEVQATDGGTTYTVTTWCELAPGQHQRVYGRAEDELRHSVNEHVRGVKELLESGALSD